MRACLLLFVANLDFFAVVFNKVLLPSALRGNTLFEMAVGIIARQGITSLSLSCSPFTSLSGRAGICASPNGCAATTSRRIVAPLLFVFIQCRSQLLASPRDSRVRWTSSSSSRGYFDDAVAILASAPVLPKLVVLDLDFTVWPFYCYNRQASGHGGPPTVYPEVVDIVKALAAYEVEMAIASRTPSASLAKKFLEQLSICQCFTSKEIYFTIYTKTKHFTALKEKTGIPYSSMLFFDDELKNVSCAAELGVTGILVTKGLDIKSLEKGLKAFALNRS